MVVGSKAQVWHGNADRTSGGLIKSDLYPPSKKDGRIKSKAKVAAGKAVWNANPHVRAAFIANQFVKVKKSPSRRRSRKSSRR